MSDFVSLRVLPRDLNQEERFRLVVIAHETTERRVRDHALKLLDHACGSGGGGDDDATRAWATIVASAPVGPGDGGR